MKKCLQKITARIKVISSYIGDELSLKSVLYLKGLPIYVFVLLYVAFIAYLTDKYIEATFQICAFLFLRYKFDTTYHAPNTAICVFITLCVITLAIPNTPTSSISILGSVINAFVVSFISWLAQYVIDLRKPKQFNIYTCNREEFIQRCREVNLNADNTKIALAYFYDKSAKIWDIANEYSIDYDSAKRRTIRIKHKLTDK